MIVESSALIPVTFPVLGSTEATEGEALNHVPLGVVHVKVVVSPLQTDEEPKIAATVGASSTDNVNVLSDIQPSAEVTVYVIILEPLATPNASPVVSLIETMDDAGLVQTPPIGVADICDVLVGQIFVPPLEEIAETIGD